jgi:hypothetical protein
MMMEWIVAIKFVCSGKAEVLKCRKQDSGGPWSGWSWFGRKWLNTRLQSKIVKCKWKWKCKGINPEGNLKQVPRWWADPCGFDDFKTGYIFGAEVDATSEVGRRGIW